MSTTTVLHETIHRRYDVLARELHDIRERFRPGHADLAEPRHTRGMIDQFLADASQHVNASNAVLVTAARRELSDGKQVVHDYLRVAKEFEVALAHIKAHAYGSTYERKFSWTEAWDELEATMERARSEEEVIADRLDEVLAERAGADLAVRLLADEDSEPTRPHPYAPHTGLLGILSRKVMRRADAFWDDAEGRMVRRKHKHHDRPGLIGRYIMARPQIDED